MPTDPNAPFSLDSDGRRADKLAELERRLTVLERGNPTIQVLGAAGAPATAPRDGTAAAGPEPRLWVRVGGAWRYVGLT